MESGGPDATDPLDAGLQRAFRRESSSDGSATRREAPALHFPDPADDPAGTELGGRYRLLEEIGRGGMGRVHRAHDRVLDREVAIKLLIDGRGASLERLRRFAEEARLVAAIEHPGIVPVHDRGVSEDGTPWFAMRLVRGGTLKDRLAAAAGDPAARRRLLPVVHRAAEAVAAAHRAGVVHRDLKPSNIMVGALGEVFVMDWGLARAAGAPGEDQSGASSGSGTVRASPSGGATLTGTVLGTPAYMAPEQAAGRVREIGPWSDVFALGAILFEVLAGRPPPRAAAGETDEEATDAMRVVLEAAEADAGFRGLVLACLSPRPASRPQDAAAVAAALAAHAGAVEERRQAAERAASAAAARAGSERRARRLQSSLLAVVLLAVAGGAGLWVAWERGRSRRGEAADRAVDEALAEAARQRDRAAAAAPEAGAGAWREALAAAEAAARIAAAPETGDLARSRAGGSVLAATEGLARAESEAAVRAADAAMLRRLDGLLQWRLEWTDPEDQDSAYAAAFREHGIDVLGLDREEIVRRIRASAIRETLVDALQNWVRGTPRSRPGAERRARWLIELARDATGHPRAREVLDLRLANRNEDLVAWLMREDLTGVPAQTLTFAAMALINAGAHEDAIRALRRIQAHHPGEVRVHAALARVLGGRGAAAQAEVARAVTATCALRPQDDNLAATLVTYLRDIGEDEAADRWLAEQRARFPRSPHLLRHAGLDAWRAGDRRAGEQLLREALAIAPDEVEVLCSLGNFLADTDRLDEAEALYRRAESAVPDNPRAHGRLGRVAMRRGRLAEAEWRLDRVLRMYPADVEMRLNLARVFKERRRWAGFVREVEASLPAATPEIRRVFNLDQIPLEAARAEVARLEALLPAALLGERDPGTANRWAELAGLCRDRGDPRTEVRIWELAFDAVPEAVLEHGLDAVEAAVLASKPAKALRRPSADQHPEAASADRTPGAAPAVVSRSSAELLDRAAAWFAGFLAAAEAAPELPAPARAHLEWLLRHPDFEALRRPEATAWTPLWERAKSRLGP